MRLPFSPTPAGQTYSIPEAALKARLEENLAELFPQLRGTAMETAWGGKMAMARHWMPLIGTDDRRPGLWWTTAYAGQCPPLN